MFITMNVETIRGCKYCVIRTQEDLEGILKYHFTVDIIKMDGEPTYAGRQGNMEYIDDIGQIHGTWGGLALQPEIDEFAIHFASGPTIVSEPLYRRILKGEIIKWN